MNSGKQIRRIAAFVGFTVAMFFLGALGGGIAGAVCTDESNAKSLQLWIMFGCGMAGIIPTVLYHCMSRFFTDSITDFLDWALDVSFFSLKRDPKWTARRVLYPAKISDDMDGDAYRRGAPYREYLAGTLDDFSFETREDAQRTVRGLIYDQERDGSDARRFFANVRVVLLNALLGVLVGLKLIVFGLIVLAPLFLFGGACSLGGISFLSFDNQPIVGLYWLIPFCLMFAGLGGVIATSFVCDWDWFRG